MVLRYLFAWFAFACALALVGASPREFQVKRWTTSDGLPHNKIQALYQTRDGYLWIGTMEGPVRFDGVRFQALGEKFGTGDGGGTCFAEDRTDGSLWIGTTEGLVHVKDGFVRRYSSQEGLPDRRVWKLLSLSNGDLWLETDRGLARFRDGGFRSYGSTNGLPPAGLSWLAEGEEGSVWLGNANGNWRYESGKDRFVAVDWPGLPKKLAINRCSRARNGDLLLSTGEGLFRRGAGGWKHYGVESGIADPRVHFTYETRDGVVWLATVSGTIHRLEEERFIEVNLGIYQKNYAIDCMFEDREGSLWVGTAEGLFRLRAKAIRALTAADGLSGEVVNSLTKGANTNEVYLATDKALHILKSDGTLEVTALPGHSPRSVCSAGDGGVWVNWAGLTYVKDRQWDITRQGGLPNNLIESLYLDRRGDLWFGLSGGVGRRTVSGFEIFGGANGAGQGGAAVFHEDGQSNLWVGNDSGLHRFAGDRFSTIDVANLEHRHIQALAHDDEGNLWFGGPDGLGLLSGGRAAFFTTAVGLPENRVNQILDDGLGHLWISGFQGLHRIAKAELLGVARGKLSRVHPVTFDETDGMPSAQTTGGFQPSGFRAQDGLLWFPTIKGAAIVDPARIELNRVPPPMHIEEVRANERTIYADLQFRGTNETTGRTVTRIPAGGGRLLEIRYTANSLVAPEKVRFASRLEGLDSEWREAPSRERKVFFTNLRPGSYVFHLKACNNHGVWSSESAAFAFSIAPAVSETIWFPVACIVGLLGGASILGGWRLRWQRRVLLAEQAATLERERARIARDLHDDLGTALSAIAFEAELAGNEQFSKERRERVTEKIVTHSRALADRMREVVWAVNPRCDSLESLLSFISEHAEKALASANVRYRLDFTMDTEEVGMTAETRHEIFLVVKEALQNVVKHSGASDVLIRARVAGEHLEIEVRDNGRGFANQESEGQGLGNMRERAKRMGAELTVVSEGEKGATVWLRVPIERRR